MSLSAKRELFAQHVASGKSQAEAYRIAYPASAKWKESSVWQKASTLAADVKVRSRIQELRDAQAQRISISSERVLQEIARLALFDPRNLFREDGTPKPINELDDNTAAAIAGLEVLEEFEGSGEDRRFIGYTKKYKVADKNAALEKLAKHLGLYAPKKIEHSGSVTQITRRVIDKGGND